MGGSGRQSLTRLASHLADYECFQIELAKGYGVAEWREDIKKVMLRSVFRLTQRNHKYLLNFSLANDINQISVK